MGVSNVINFPVKGKFDMDYIFDDNDKVVGITREDWGFRIQRNGDRIAFVSDVDDQPFGELDAEVFNTVIGCWLMIDDVETLKGCSEGLRNAEKGMTPLDPEYAKMIDENFWELT